MVTIAKINRDAAKHLPSSQYDHPSDVVAEPLMTRGEKIGTLNRWRQQVAEELAASDEGMPTQRTSGRHHALIGAIDAALGELNVAGGAP